jgi:hypothetical protein
VEKGDKEISNWFKMCCKVWGVDLTLFFKLFLYFYIIYILSIYFICIFERSTGQKHSSQQKTKIMLVQKKKTALQIRNLLRITNKYAVIGENEMRNKDAREYLYNTQDDDKIYNVIDNGSHFLIWD